MRIVETVEIKKLTGRRKAIRAVVFCLIAALLFVGVNKLVHPAWLEWNNYNTTNGFYQEPENTIETVFLGTSSVVNGITPMELYENYGICSYNMGTEQQPMMGSYYWLEEVYRLHSETLDTVVLEASLLRRTASDAYYRKALDTMKFSDVKFRAVKEYAADFNEFLSCLIPVLSYHDRWKELSQDDFAKVGQQAPTYTRGYNFTTANQAERVSSYTSIRVPYYNVNEEAIPYTLNSDSVSYLDRMVEFCQEHGLKLVLFKTPSFEYWSSSLHNAVQNLADKYGLDFLDFNYSPYLDELDYNHATDSYDGRHMNFYGAQKVTDWLGEYLISECGNRDVRSDERYAFLETELSQYHRHCAQAELEQLEDPYSYLSYLTEEGDYTAFLTVQGDAASALSQEERQGFSSMGLTKLSELGEDDSYLAVLDGQTVVTELSGDSPGSYPRVSTSAGRYADVSAETAALSLTYRGTLSDGTSYKLVSGGTYMGDVSSCVIDGEEQSSEQDGINIVVYDNLLGEVVDSAYFETGTSSTRKPRNAQTELAELEAGERTYETLSAAAQRTYDYNQACADQRAALGLS